MGDSFTMYEDTATIEELRAMLVLHVRALHPGGVVDAVQRLQDLPTSDPELAESLQKVAILPLPEGDLLQDRTTDARGKKRKNA